MKLFNDFKSFARNSKGSFLLSIGSFFMGVAATLIAVVLILPSLETTSTAPINTQATQVPHSHRITGHPIRINIPELGINLTVIDGFYNAGSQQWTLTLDKAQFATITSLPNNIAGNTFIYGHYRRNVFEDLHLIKPDYKAYITTNNGYTFIYKFKNTFSVNPSDTQILNYKGRPTLTLQTCSGAFFQHRQMYRFEYVGYKKT